MKWNQLLFNDDNKKIHDMINNKVWGNEWMKMWKQQQSNKNKTNQKSNEWRMRGSKIQNITYINK